MTFTSQEAETNISQERIPLVLSALSEGIVDPAPAKWAVLGNLRCEMHSGQVVDIGVYTIDDRELAFRTDQQHYFRGVDTAKLAAAVGHQQSAEPP